MRKKKWEVEKEGKTYLISDVFNDKKDYKITVKEDCWDNIFISRKGLKILYSMIGDVLNENS